EDVVGRRHHNRGSVDAAEEALQVRLDLLRCAPTGLRRRPRELVHIGALVVVQPKDAGKRREHRPRWADPPLLEARVVVSRDRRELGDLLATQAGDSPLPPTFGQVDVARTELGAAGAQEGAELVLLLIAAVHRRRRLSPRCGDAGWVRSLLGSL